MSKTILAIVLILASAHAASAQTPKDFARITAMLLIYDGKCGGLSPRTREMLRRALTLLAGAVARKNFGSGHRGAPATAAVYRGRCRNSLTSPRKAVNRSDDILGQMRY
jgi:hypothetical protein